MAGFLTSVLGKGKKNGSKKKAFKKADMGDSMAFYYNEELKMYVERGKEQEAKAASAPPPPPPKWVNKSTHKSTATVKPATTGVHSKYATLPGLEEATPTSSPASLAPSWSKPKSAARLGNVKTFVPNIAMAQAAMAAEEEARRDHASKDSGDDVGNSNTDSSSTIPSRLAAHAAPPLVGSAPASETVVQNNSDAVPSDLSPPHTTTGNVGGADSTLTSHPLQSAAASPLPSPEQNGAFGSFLHGHPSPGGESVTSAGDYQHILNGDSGPLHAMRPAAQAQPLLPAGGVQSTIAQGQHHDSGASATNGAAHAPASFDAADSTTDAAAVTHQGQVELVSEADRSNGAGIVDADESVAVGNEHDVHEGAAETAAEWEAQHGVHYAPAPAEGEVASPWVSFWYSDWPETAWTTQYENSPELYYFHFQAKAQAEGWQDAEWVQHREQCPDHYDHIEYFNLEWERRGTPTYPMPKEGQPLVGGGYVTAEWLSATQAALEAAEFADEATGGEQAAESSMAEPEVARLGAVEELGGQVNEDATDELAGMETLTEQVTLMQHPIIDTQDNLGEGVQTPRLLSAEALLSADAGEAAADAAYAAELHRPNGVNGHREEEENGYFQGSASKSPNGRVLKVEDIDYEPDPQQIQELIAKYAVPMRPESCAGSDDDRLYRAQPDASPRSPAARDEGAPGHADDRGRRGHRFLRGSSSVSGSEADGAGEESSDDDEGGPDPGQDAEDVFGDMGSMLAVASPSSCHRHEEEARVATGTLGTAVAAAESAAAMRHMEAALDTEQSAAEAAQSVDASYANSVHLSDGQSEAPSSMCVHAPSEAVMEETDGASNAAGGIIELPNIPEGSADLEDLPVLPPMHGDVPSTTRPEINITDLERRGMRVGAHTASCAAEAASTQAASDKGSDDDGGGGGHSSGGAGRTAATSAGGVGGSGPEQSGSAPGQRAAQAAAADAQLRTAGDGTARGILEELGRVNAMLHAAGLSGEIPDDVSTLFGALRQHIDDVAGTMRGHKTLASQLDQVNLASAASAAAPAAVQAEASQQAGTPGLLSTPTRSDAAHMTPIQTPGILSNMTTPEPHAPPTEDAAGRLSLPMNFQAAANPLYAQTMSPETAGFHAQLGGGSNTGTAAPAPAPAPFDSEAAAAASAAALSELQAELESKAAEADELRSALDESTTENEDLRRRIMEAEAREEAAAARLQAAIAARDAAAAELADAREAERDLRQRLDEAQAQNSSLQDAVAVTQQAADDAKVAASEQAVAAAAAAAEAAGLAEAKAAATLAAVQQQLRNSEAVVQEQARALAAAQAQAQAAAAAERAEAEEAHAAHTVAAAALQAAEAAAEALRGDVEAAQAEAAAAAASAAAQAADAAELREALELVQAERVAAAAELAEARAALENMQQEQSAIQESLRAAVEAQTAASAGQRAAEAEGNALRERVAGSEESAAALQQQIDAAETSAAELRQKLFSAQQEGAALSQQLQEAQAALDSAQAAAAEVSQRCADAEATVEELTADLDLSVLAMGMETDKVAAMEEYVATLGGDATDLLERIEAEHTTAQEGSEAGSEGGSEGGGSVGEGAGDGADADEAASAGVDDVANGVATDAGHAFGSSAEQSPATRSSPEVHADDAAGEGAEAPDMWGAAAAAEEQGGLQAVPEEPVHAGGDADADVHEEVAAAAGCPQFFDDAPVSDGGWWSWDAVQDAPAPAGNAPAAGPVAQGAPAANAAGGEVLFFNGAVQDAPAPADDALTGGYDAQPAPAAGGESLFFDDADGGWGGWDDGGQEAAWPAHAEEQAVASAPAAADSGTAGGAWVAAGVTHGGAVDAAHAEKPAAVWGGAGSSGFAAPAPDSWGFSAAGTAHMGDSGAPLMGDSPAEGAAHEGMGGFFDEFQDGWGEDQDVAQGAGFQQQTVGLAPALGAGDGAAQGAAFQPQHLGGSPPAWGSAPEAPAYGHAADTAQGGTQSMWGHPEEGWADQDGWGGSGGWGEAGWGGAEWQEGGDAAWGAAQAAQDSAGPGDTGWGAAEPHPTGTDSNASGGRFFV
eukprot:jgi/Ulvmu1/7441/UM036_0103.1